MTSQDAQIDVHNDVERSRFAVEIDGQHAKLDYRLSGERLTLVHTEVPEALEGHGLGGKLVRAAVAYAVENDFVIAARCSYARKWLEDHPDVAGTVTIDWSEPHG